MKKEKLRIEKVRKSPFLKKIDIQLLEGEVTYCIFSNSQEKDAMLKIFTGHECKEGGKIYYDEEQITVGLTEVLSEKIQLITATNKLIAELSISENLFLMQKKVKENWVNYHKLDSNARELCVEFNLDIDIHQGISTLTFFQKVELEILKSYLLQKEIIILSDVYNYINAYEKKALWQLIDKMKRLNIGFMLIDILENLDFINVFNVHVIKNGRTCIIKNIDFCDYTMLHTVLYQDELKKVHGDFRGVEMEDNEGFQFLKLSTMQLNHINIRCPKGMVTKLLCLDGKSFKEIVELFRGNVELYNGSINDGKKITAIKSITGIPQGIGVIDTGVNDRGLFQDLSVMDNLQMLLSQKIKYVWNASKYKKSVQEQLTGILPDEIYGRSVNSLSTSEKIKINYCKWLLYSPKVLVCIQPFGEGGLETREVIREMLLLLKKRGIPILMITDNSGEMNYYQGRDIFIRHGEMVGKEELYSGFIY